MDMSHQALSADTEVVLLLCGRFGGEKQEAHQPLSPSEYAELAKWLNGLGLRPADLLTDAGQAQLHTVHETRVERQRIDFLLARGTAMALAMERWSRGGIWVISRGDPEFPKRLKRLLKHAAPPLLYGAGEKGLLDAGGLAVVGSRDASEGALAFTQKLAAQCAREGLAVVSGGARGVDAAAMQGATEAGGRSIGVLGNDLLKTSVNRQNREGLQEGRLVLVSPFYPEAGFHPGHAMGRNKYIYALADRALVIDSARGSGGTWEGAMEVLRHRWVPLYVRSPGEGPGNAALLTKGGIAFTFEPGRGETLLEFFERADAGNPEAESQSLAQHSLLDYPPSASPTPVLAKEPSPPPMDPSPAPPPATTLDMYEDFLVKASRAVAAGPLTEEEVAERLGLEKGQAKAWLKKAVDAGNLEKLKRPVRYGTGVQGSLIG